MIVLKKLLTKLIKECVIRREKIFGVYKMMLMEIICDKIDNVEI